MKGREKNTYKIGPNYFGINQLKLIKMNFTEGYNNLLMRSNLSAMNDRNDFYRLSLDNQDRGFFNKSNFRSQLNRWAEINDPINFLCDQLNQENTKYDSQIFQFEGQKSSDVSETCSVYANAEDDECTEEKTLDDSPATSSEEKIIMQLVKKQISETCLDNLLEEWWTSKEIKDPVKNSEKIRFKTTKSPYQVQKLNEWIEKFPLKFPKKERIKLANEIGLEEVQIYKWYYDNNPNKRTKKAKKSQLESLDTLSS